MNDRLTLGCAVESLTKLVKEGEDCGIQMARDRVGCKLVQCIDNAQAWLERCHRVLTELKVCHICYIER